jgi:hypothetical protein
MGKLTSLEEVDSSVLPAKVLVLLSKYAQAMRKHTGLVIKISSLNVFKHVQNTSQLTDHHQVSQLHQELLREVNSHIRAGSMRTFQQLEIEELPGLQRSVKGEILVSRNSARLNSNNLEIESTLSINF